MDPYRDSAQPASTIRRYTPSGHGGIIAVFDVLAAATVGGVIAGVVEGFIDQWFSLLVAFQLIIGFAAGGAASWMVGRKRLRAPVHAFLAAALGGAIGYASVHVVDYERFRAEATAELANSDTALPDGTTLDDLLVTETGHGGFAGYMVVAAKIGINITSAGGSSHDGKDKEAMFTGKAAWGFWLGELLLAAGFAGILASVRARHPFCEPCGQWFATGTTQLAAGGSGLGKYATQMAAAVDGGQFDAVARELAPPSISESSYAIVMHRCTGCAERVAVTLRAVTNDGKKIRSTDYATWTMTPADATAIVAAVAQARAAHGTPPA